jgi:hypothetical protein
MVRQYPLPFENCGIKSTHSVSLMFGHATLQSLVRMGTRGLCVECGTAAEAPAPATCLQQLALNDTCT